MSKYNLCEQAACKMLMKLLTPYGSIFPGSGHERKIKRNLAQKAECEAEKSPIWTFSFYSILNR